MRETDTEHDAQDTHMEKDDPVPPWESNSRRCPSVPESKCGGGRLGEVEETESHWMDRMDS